MNSIQALKRSHVTVHGSLSISIVKAIAKTYQIDLQPSAGLSAILGGCWHCHVRRRESRLVLPTTGVLIPIGDTQALADGLDRLLMPPSLRVSLDVEALSIVMQSCSVESWFGKIRSVYDDAVKERE